MEIGLTFLHLSLLQAEEVRIQIIEDLFESFFKNGPEAVDVPADIFHCLIFVGLFLNQ